ncbi:hypothetical protein D9615_006719 [Tricholomella constricta]|uniref:HTH CENPB-type domain-containing protein n=1 Tax=Tricholomella constricta TaxID=117010 RepID=A0A8H5H7D4_9AGAR|nr:hypothetical protein D9615_006719 [Tricholomella constricta]
MTRNAYSELRKAQVEVKIRNQLQDKAVELWKQEQQTPTGKGNKPLGLRTICDTIISSHLQQTGKYVPLSYSTLAKHVNGGRRLADFNAEKSWLTDGEATVLIDYALEMAGRNFPFSRRRLKEHADEIIRAKLGGNFASVGENWIDRFTTKHHDRLKPCWSSSLDDSRGRAVNPNNHKLFYKLFKNAKDGCGNPDDAVPDDLVYGADETGVQKGIGVKERVFGPAGAKVQHQQRSGDRENITVLPTICADGTYLAPVTIYKGDGFQVKWCQENPLNSSLGYSKKGYTDGEIGVAWIQNFDKQTKAKANGRYRLLVVDGHNSHYTRGFLEHARTNKIRVLCYPSHSTHVYQGLDVVIFGVLKRYWSEERDKFERDTKTKVSKENFLRVYAAAHVRAFTPENIKAAFRKTGLVPFNPSAVTPEMMAPSRETSSQGVMPLADQQTSPVRAVSQLLREHAACKRKASETEELGDSPASKTPRTSQPPPHQQRLPQTPSRHRPETNGTPSLFLRSTGMLHATHPVYDLCTPSPVRRALFGLTSSSASFLVSPSPIASSSRLPVLVTSVISPSKPQYAALLQEPPRTLREEQLMNALRDAEIKNHTLKENNRVLQAQAVLQDLYVGSVRAELQAQEEKKSKKKSRKLNADGLPKLLDCDEFFQRVVDDDERRKLDEAEKVRKRAARGAATESRKKWIEEDEKRKQRNNDMMQEWEKAVKEWETERERAKTLHQRPRWNKPPRPKAEPAKPKTWLKNAANQITIAEDAEGEDGDDPMEDEEEDNSGGEEDDE